jgi:hypothetical protein
MQQEMILFSLVHLGQKPRQVYTPHMKVIASGGLADVRLKKDMFIPDT